MAHAQKPDFVFRRNWRVHLNRRGASVQSTTGSRGVRISGSNAGYTMFPFTSLPVRRRVPSYFNWTLPGNSHFCREHTAIPLNHVTNSLDFPRLSDYSQKLLFGTLEVLEEGSKNIVLQVLKPFRLANFYQTTRRQTSDDNIIPLI